MLRRICGSRSGWLARVFLTVRGDMAPGGGVVPAEGRTMLGRVGLDVGGFW